MTEGVDVIKNINYGLVRFTRQEFLDTIRYWKWKTKDMSRRDRLSVWYTIFIAATRYTLHIEPYIFHFRETARRFNKSYNQCCRQK